MGSVYIRKVQFRDAGMIKQIEEKVVNRLRQVTSAIKQAGANQVSVITSSAEREASIEFAKAAGAKRAMLLPVSAPFHCALMAPAAEAMAQALAEVTIRPPAVPGEERLRVGIAGDQHQLGPSSALGRLTDRGVVVDDDDPSRRAHHDIAA